MPESLAPARRRYGKQVTAEIWERMRAAYAERATAMAIVDAVPGIGKRLATVAIDKGFPELGKPALKTIISEDAVAVTRVLAKYRAQFAADPELRDETVRRKAEEALAARAALDVSLRACVAITEFSNRVFQLWDAGKIQIDKVTPREISMLARATASVVGAVKEAVDIQRRAAGEPTELIGVKLGVLMQDCTPDELEYIQQSGKLPARLLGFIDTQAIPPGEEGEEHAEEAADETEAG